MVKSAQKQVPQFKPSSAAASSRMRTVKQKDNPVELALRSLLHSRGLRFRAHYKVAPQIRARPDIAFVASRVAVFVDGCFWHRCPKHGTLPKSNDAWWLAKLNANVDRDRNADGQLRRIGWRVIRVWEHEDPVRAAAKIAAVVRRRIKLPAA